MFGLSLKRAGLALLGGWTPVSRSNAFSSLVGICILA